MLLLVVLFLTDLPESPLPPPPKVLLFSILFPFTSDKRPQTPFPSVAKRTPLACSPLRVGDMLFPFSLAGLSAHWTLRLIQCGCSAPE